MTRFYEEHAEFEMKEEGREMEIHSAICLMVVILVQLPEKLAKNEEKKIKIKAESTESVERSNSFELCRLSMTIWIKTKHGDLDATWE